MFDDVIFTRPATGNSTTTAATTAAATECLGQPGYGSVSATDLWG